MNSLNIYALTRVDDPSLFIRYEKSLSHRESVLKENFAEQKSLKILVEELACHNVKSCKYNGFYYSYSIPQISKEFDLIKIAENKGTVLDIELKSEMISEEKICNQLKRNKYYLQSITEYVQLYTFVSSEKRCFTLAENDVFYECGFSQLVMAVTSFNDFYKRKIEDLFDPVSFLISPINTPEKFLHGKYFLTSQQEDIKNKIMESFQKRDHYVAAIEGEAGAGKTLLLYDMALRCAELNDVCLIHCGIISEGHLFLKNNIENINIIPIKEVDEDLDLSRYRYIFVDESQRIRSNQLEIIQASMKKNKICGMFSLDPQQILTKTEYNHPSEDNITSFCDDVYKLKGKIRTNKEMSSFVKNIFDLNKRSENYSYDDVDVIYANDTNEMRSLLETFIDMEYTFINYTPSRYKSGSLDRFTDLSNGLNAHKVLGQEFDNIVLFLGPEFYYENSYLRSGDHPNPDYLYNKMLFQIMTRVRKKLCILVLANKDVFQKVLSIKERKK